MPPDAFFSLALLAALHGWARRAPTWVWLAWRWPGTVAHELSHALVGVLTGLRVQGVTIWPRKVGALPGGKIAWTLGSVSLEGPSWRMLPAALAPLWLVVLGAGLGHEWLLAPAPPVVRLAQAYLVTSLIQAGLPSSTDFRVGLGPWVGLALLGAVLLAISP